MEIVDIKQTQIFASYLSRSIFTRWCCSPNLGLRGDKGDCLAASASRGQEPRGEAHGILGEIGRACSGRTEDAGAGGDGRRGDGGLAHGFGRVELDGNIERFSGDMHFFCIFCVWVFDSNLGEATGDK